MKTRFFIMFVLFTIFSACTVQDNNMNEGIVWFYIPDSPVTYGIETDKEAVYFAEENGITSLWKRTGDLRWSRRLENETVTGFYLDENSLLISSINEDSQISYLRAYELSQGELIQKTEIKTYQFLKNPSLTVQVSDQTKDFFYRKTDNGIEKINPYGKPEWTFTLEHKTDNNTVILSEFYELAGILDDTGTLNIIDIKNGAIVTQKFIGKKTSETTREFYDSSEELIFYPLDSPSRIVCYSLEYPSGLKDKEETSGIINFDE